MSASHAYAAGAEPILLPPTGVSTMSSMWRGPSGERLSGATPFVFRAAVYVVVAIALAIGSYVAVERLVG